MKIRTAKPTDQQKIIELIAQFRVTLAKFKGKQPAPDIKAAQEEWKDYQSNPYSIFVAETNDEEIFGYLICRVSDDIVWAESLYVVPRMRRKGIAARLYIEAERLAAALGSETVYNWVHPNNDIMIRFLKKHGYEVLNLIELRRPRTGEKLMQKIRVGDHVYKY